MSQSTPNPQPTGGNGTDEMDALTEQRNRFAAALWDIRIKTERWSVDDDPATFANVIIFTALAALGDFKEQAQVLHRSNRGPHA